MSRRTFCVLVVLLVGVALSSREARAGDVDAAKRWIDTAQSDLEHQDAGSAESDLKHAEGMLDGLDDATRAPLQSQIDELRKSIGSSQSDSEKKSFVGTLDRKLNVVKQDIQDGAPADSVADELHGVEQTIAGEDGQRLLNDSERAQYAEKIGQLRKDLGEQALGALLKETTDALTEDEAILAGHQENKYGDSDQFRNHLDRLDERLREGTQALKTAGIPFDEGDPRLASAHARINQAKSDLGKAANAAERDEIVGEAVDYWKYVLETYASKSEGWQDEKAPPSYEEFLSTQPSLHTEKTEKRYELADRWFDDDRSRKALQLFPDDPRLQATLAEVKKVRDESGSKILGFANQLLDQLEKAGPKDQWGNTNWGVQEIQRIVGESAKGVMGQEAALARAGGLVKKWERQASEEGAAKAALEAALTKAAGEVWPTYLEHYTDIAEIDASACLADIDSCKGKVVRFKGYPNRLGWEWWPDTYDWLTPVNGTPVVGKFDAGVDAAIQQMEKATGFDHRDFGEHVEDVIGVVESICKIERRDFEIFTKEPYRAGTVSAPCIRITAIRMGPFAVAAGQGTALEKIANMPPVVAQEAGAMRKP